MEIPILALSGGRNGRLAMLMTARNIPPMPPGMSPDRYQLHLDGFVFQFKVLAIAGSWRKSLLKLEDDTPEKIGFHVMEARGELADFLGGLTRVKGS